MSGNNPNVTLPSVVDAQAVAASADAPPSSPPARKRSPFPLIIVALLLIIVPFLAWYGTWFGRNLSDEEITEYLQDEGKPRHIQHALAQIEKAIERGDKRARRWYPQIVKLSQHHSTEIRQTVAWVMGQDNQSEEFHTTLLQLLNDQHPLVRRNAAVQLTRFKDASGRSELRAMLKPYFVNAPIEGTVSHLVADETEVREGMLLARIKSQDGRVEEVRAVLPGKVSNTGAQEGMKVEAGKAIFSIAPNQNFVYEALRALYWVGTIEDLPDVKRYTEKMEGMPESVQQQAIMTAKAIEGRARGKSPVDKNP